MTNDAQDKNRITIERGCVLLVLSDRCPYFFRSLYYEPEYSDSTGPVEYDAGPHIGTFVDSFVITAEYQRINIGYYPQSDGVRIYRTRTDGAPLYIENAGAAPTTVTTLTGTIRLNPGERRQHKNPNS